ncbi:MAG: YccF domain-containing protein [Motilibacteraceae bacterium]
MRLIGNILWFLLAGVWLAISFALAGLVMFVLIVTIPFGIASFRLAGYALWPFGRTTVSKPSAGAASAIGNVLWFLLAGIWIALECIVAGLVLCVTIIGIPFGVAAFKLAAVALFPLGKDVVSVEEAQRQRSVIGT